MLGPISKKPNRLLLIALIVVTSLAYLLLLTQVDYSLMQSDPEAFWVVMAGTLGSIVGFITMNLMLWQNMLGNRHIVRQFSPDLIWATKIHIFIGKYALLLILLHPLLVMYSYLEDLLWIITPDLSSDLGIMIGLGRIALILLFVIYVTSALLRSKMKYRPWLYIHYLTYVIILLVFFHARSIGIYLGSIPALQAFWLTLLVGFIGLIIYRITMYSGYTKAKYEITSVKKQGPDIITITLKPLGKKLIPKVGQFIYIQLRNFGESHPFTVTRFNDLSGELIFSFQKVGKFTKKFSSSKVGDTVFLDGPYGVFTLEGQSSDPKVILAGGIGVTPFIELVERYADNNTYMFYSSRKYDETLEEKMLIGKLKERFHLCLSQEKSNQVHVINGRLNHQIFSEHMSGTDLASFNYFICGSKHYIEGMKTILEEASISKSKIFIEEFTI